MHSFKRLLLFNRENKEASTFPFIVEMVFTFIGCFVKGLEILCSAIISKNNYIQIYSYRPKI